MELIFATNNAHKLKEIKAVLNDAFIIKGLKESGVNEDIPEDHDTLEENALQKARYIHSLLGKNCFSDDTGLEVVALDGAPGVYSARYAGEDADFNRNNAKLLKELEGVDNRSARFRTVIALIYNGHEYLFEGICNGAILEERRGNKGFGYDPVFIPNGFSKSFGEMKQKTKNTISHRAKAIQKLATFLEKKLAV